MMNPEQNSARERTLKSNQKRCPLPREIRLYGRDILRSEGMQKSKGFIQHGKISVYRHSVQVAEECLRIARGLGLKVDQATLVRGALLHDYFLYDWHIPCEEGKWHAFMHPIRACRNAQRDFHLNKAEQNMILSHMFPLSLHFPLCKESWILLTADKICAFREFWKRWK